MNKLINNSINQHFISRVEQKFNSINGGKKQIYKFEIEDKRYSILKGPEINDINGSKNGALFYKYLYSFKKSGDMNHNFEIIFQSYENEIKNLTETILDLKDKQKICTENLKKLFAVKFLNCLRNPYSIKGTIKTFYKNINKILPINTCPPKDYKEIMKNENLPYIFSNIGISIDIYNKWIEILFLMLVNFEKSNGNIFDKIIEMIFKNNIVSINICRYDERATGNCLLSDKGYIYYKTNNEIFSKYAFNLSSNCFVNYELIFIDNQSKKLYKGGIEDTINVFQNDIPKLKMYNKDVIKYSYKNIYSNSKNILI